MLIAENSPLRWLPQQYSKQQVLVFDGVRYSAEIADIAYERLINDVARITGKKQGEITCRDIAAAALDAWSIVDSVNRMRDLLRHLKNLKHDTWYELFERKTEVVGRLRNNVQHLEGEVVRLSEKPGQLLGYLSWAAVGQGWFCAIPGATYTGDTYLTVSEMDRCVSGPVGAVKLRAYGEIVDFEPLMIAVREAVQNLTTLVTDGKIRPDTPAAAGRNIGDLVYSMVVETLMPYVKPDQRT